MRTKRRKRKASTAPSPTSHGFLWTTAGGSRAGSAAWPPGWGSPPLPASLPPPLGLTGVGLNWPQDQSCQKGESARGHPESAHPSPSVLAPAQWVLGCSQAGGGSGLHPSAGCGRRHHRKWGVVWGSLPWVPGSLGWGPGSQASQRPVSLKLTLTPSLPTARALKGGGSGKVGNSCPEYLECARSCNRS